MDDQVIQQLMQQFGMGPEVGGMPQQSEMPMQQMAQAQTMKPPVVDGSDGGNAARIDALIDEHDPSEFVKYPGKKALTETLGLKVSPELEAFWDKTDPMDRMSIIEAIQNSAGMASDDDTMREAQEYTNDDEGGTEKEIINEMMKDENEKRAR